MAEPWTHEYVEVNGLKFHCVTMGEGPLLVLLHGFPQNWYAWHKLIPDLAKKYKVVAPDLRGYNETEKPPKVSDYQIDLLVSDVVGIIKHYGAKSARIASHDWGAAVAWALAFTHPEMVEKLVIINVPHPAKLALALTGRNPRQMLRSWYIFFFQLPWIAEKMLTANKGRNVARMLKGATINRAAFSREELDFYREAMLRPGAARATVNWYRAAFRNLRGQNAIKKKGAAEIKSPTLIIWGEQDVALGKELTYGMERWIKAPFEIKYVPDSGHFVIEEKPEEVKQWITEFMA